MIQLEREKLLSELEQKIGYSFRSRALLDRALTHRSFANERVGENCPHNEAMEFLGDSVLGFVVSAWLLERFPVLYVDGGITVAERFLRRELRQKLMSLNPASMIGADYKSALQERLQASGGPGPEYVVVEVMGPDHRRTFRVELRVGGRAVSTGEGHTIKLAQQEAARVALESPDEAASIEREGEQNSQQKTEQDREEKRRSVAIGSDYEASTSPAVEAFESEPSRETSARALDVYADEDLIETKLEV